MTYIKFSLFSLDTVSFVNTLFEILQNNSYIPAPPTPTTPLPEPPKPSIPPEPPKPSNPPAPPKPSNPPAPPKPVAKRLLSTEESLRPQAAEVNCSIRIGNCG